MTVRSVGSELASTSMKMGERSGDEYSLRGSANASSGTAKRCSFILPAVRAHCLSVTAINRLDWHSKMRR